MGKTTVGKTHAAELCTPYVVRFCDHVNLLIGVYLPLK